MLEHNYRKGIPSHYYNFGRIQMNSVEKKIIVYIDHNNLIQDALGLDGGSVIVTPNEKFHAADKTNTIADAIVTEYESYLHNM